MSELTQKQQNVPLKTAGTIFVSVKKFFLIPLQSGLFGFAAFFTTVLIAKYIGSFFQGFEYAVDVEDVYLSSLGFFLVFLIKILENFKK